MSLLHGRRPGLGFEGGQKIATLKRPFLENFFIFPPKNSDDLFSHFVIWNVGYFPWNALTKPRKPHNVSVQNVFCQCAWRVFVSVHNVFPKYWGTDTRTFPPPQTFGEPSPQSSKSPPVLFCLRNNYMDDPILWLVSSLVILKLRLAPLKS